MALKLTNLSKKFGSKNVFVDFNFEFEDIGLYVISGESGVGKTTLLRIICGLDKDYLGGVSGGGIDMCSMHFQEYRLFPEISALDNILVASFDKVTEKDVENVKKLLGRLKISSFDMMRLPEELSGGMKQRISLARAILKNSPILLLDEPTKELDSELVGEVKKIILEQSQKRLVIVVTHDTELFNDASAKIISVNNMHENI